MMRLRSMLRRRWLRWTLIGVVLVLLVAGFWYMRFGRPCEADDLCVREPASNSGNPLVGVYGTAPEHIAAEGWVWAYHVTLYADGTLCRRIGNERAEEGYWSTTRDERHGNAYDDSVQHRWDIDFTVIKACGADPGSSGKWSNSMDISAVEAPDGSMRDIWMNIWWGLGPPTSLKKLR